MRLIIPSPPDGAYDLIVEADFVDIDNVLSKRMETVDDDIRDAALKFIENAKADDKLFFLAQSDPHAHRHPLIGKIQKIAKLQKRLAIHEAGMA